MSAGHSRQFVANVHGWLLLLPAAVLLVLFTHFPAVATLWHSFFSTPKGARGSVFVGVDKAWKQVGL